MPSWNAADSYDPDAYYTEASDKKGRGEPIQTRVPPQIAGGIAALVQSGKIPQYQTMSDFVRNAVVHQLHKDAERTKDELLRRRVTMVTLLSRELTLKRESEDYAALIAMITEQVSQLRDLGKDAEANIYLKNRLAEIDVLPERFQSDYEKRLTAKLYPA